MVGKWNMIVPSVCWSCAVVCVHRVMAEAEAAALNHTPVVGCRTLDVLHVAAAKLIGTREFCTFDARQSSLPDGLD